MVIRVTILDVVHLTTMKTLGHEMAVEWCENFVLMILIFVSEDLFCNTYVVDVALTLQYQFPGSKILHDA